METTAFALAVEYAWTHISMDPVAVNIQCWRGERARLRVHAGGAGAGLLTAPVGAGR